MNKQTTDILIVGGGIIGLSLALTLRKKDKKKSITLIEKEASCGQHSSGRNSGVLHAGFYYSADSLKARFSKEGNKRLTDYCLNNNLKINRCGKLVVAKNEAELSTLAELKKRAEVNGVELNEISEQEAKEIEPRVKTFSKALFSPTTSTVDCKQLVDSLAAGCQEKNIKIINNCRYLFKTKNGIRTDKGDFSYGYLINAAGLYADKIAKDFGFAKDYTILPFKGLYLYSNEPSGSLRTNVYPLPNLKNPFLGTHFTLTADNNLKIGPTATPAFWREQYNFLNNFKLNEFLQISSLELSLFFKAGFNFRGLALQEILKYYRPHLLRQGAELIEGIKDSNYRQYGKPGIRAQLVDLKKRIMVEDFLFEANESSLHILNAVSPAFTCAFPFSEYILSQTEKHV